MTTNLDALPTALYVHLTSSSMWSGSLSARVPLLPNRSQEENPWKTSTREALAPLLVDRRHPTAEHARHLIASPHPGHVDQAGHQRDALVIVELAQLGDIQHPMLDLGLGDLLQPHLGRPEQVQIAQVLLEPRQRRAARGLLEVVSRGGTPPCWDLQQSFHPGDVVAPMRLMMPKKNPWLTSALTRAAILSKTVNPGSSKLLRVSSSKATLIRSAGLSLIRASVRMVSSTRMRAASRSLLTPWRARTSAWWWRRVRSESWEHSTSVARSRRLRT